MYTRFREDYDRNVRIRGAKPTRVRMPWYDRDALILVAARMLGKTDEELPSSHDTITIDGIEIAEVRSPR